MHKHIFVMFIIFLGFGSFLRIDVSNAVGSGLVISQVQLGDSSSASNEFVELYNNSVDDIDITSLCIYYASSSNIEIGNKMGCFNTENIGVHLFLPSFSYSIAISTQLHTLIPDFGSDLRFSSTLSGSSGHIRLVDENKIELDKLAWGVNSLSPEGKLAVAAPSVGKVLSRKFSENSYLSDTNVNADDFEIISPKQAYSYGSIYEVQDVCSNIDGIQSTIPVGYEYNPSSGCTPLVVDACSNISGNQENIPKEYVDSGGGVCLFDISDIKITELMPNPSGADEESEYIELYNSEDKIVDLSNYILKIGVDSKEYSFPAGSYIEPSKYVTFYNKEIGFTLINSSSVVRLFSLDGQIVDESIAYTNPVDGFSWALIDSLWQFTNQPTPNALNLVSLKETTQENNLEMCPSGQYRSLETNRCRLIISSTSNLVPCRDGQYRSEETNRCRNILSNINILQPCDEDQERNPETNRCRSSQSVLGSSSLTPCKEGQERNPETNRCRNITNAAIPKVGFAPEKTVNESSKAAFWITLSLFALSAILYGIWEWRWEIGRMVKKVSVFIKPTK